MDCMTDCCVISITNIVKTEIANISFSPKKTNSGMAKRSIKALIVLTPHSVSVSVVQL